MDVAGSKPVEFRGSSLDDLRAFPLTARSLSENYLRWHLKTGRWRSTNIWLETGPRVAAAGNRFRSGWTRDFDENNHRRLSAGLHGCMEPQNVMRQADQRPLSFYFVFSA